MVEKEYENLTSFSVGLDDQRQTVVCHQDLKLESHKLSGNLEISQVPSDQHSKSNACNYSPKKNLKMSSLTNKKLTNSQSHVKPRRPDKQLYVPKAKRREKPLITNTDVDHVKKCEDKVLSNITEKHNHTMKTSENKCILKIQDVSSKLNISHEIVSVHGETLIENVTQNEESISCSNNKINVSVSELSINECNTNVAEAITSLNDANGVDDNEKENDLKIEHLEILDSHFRDSCNAAKKEMADCTSTSFESIFNEKKETVNIKEENCEVECNVSTDSEPQDISLENLEESWDNIYDDSGNCLNPEIAKEITKTLGKVKIQTPTIDYLNFQPKCPEVGDEFNHVIEIYDFPTEFKTEDLISAFSMFRNSGYDIKWVDDTHALGVFPSALVASEALSINHPFVKTRPLSQGVRASKVKAQRCGEFLLPYKARPETSAQLARRLVSGALGLQVPITKQQREAEKKLLKEARDKRRLAVQQRQAAWEGTLESES